VTLLFTGLRDYRSDPEGMRTDLRRQNKLIEKAFADLLAVTRALPAPRFVAQSAIAELDGFIVADATTGSLTVTLPPVGPDDAGHSVLVCKSDTSGNTVNVVPAKETQRINAAAGVDAIAPAGAREYFWDGQNGWWRR
jgi:hypothetical protein